MAIQANRRKRKHEHIASEQEDEGEVEVPKKIAKDSHTPKQKKGKNATEQQQENNVSADTIAVETDKSPKKRKKKAKVNDADGSQNEVQQTFEQVAEESTKPIEKQKRKHKQQSEIGMDLNMDAAGKDDIAADEADISPDSGIEPEEPVTRFPNDFKMMNFRNKLRGNSFVTELRHFLHMCHIRPKIVAKYIEKRGKPLELAEAFERIDKNNVLHVGYLCEALQRIVMEVLTHQKSHMESAVHGCRYFLKAHGSVLEQLLQSPRPQHRRNALKLLTAIVCVEPQLGRQVLASYDILSNVKTMENLLSHSKTDYNDEDTVRKAYIHFVLSFLVDGNMLLTRNILDKRQLIGVLAKGLVYDDHVTACVVLNALRQYVIECTDISKTKKIHVFDLECCKSLRRLYDWLGPQALAAQYSGKRLPPQELVVPEHREAVASATHELLLVLLTSRKYGITFDAMAHYRQKHNSLQGKVIGSLYRPYADWRKVELVTKTLKACPELARHTVRNFASLLNPLRTPLSSLPQAADFLAHVIAAVPPSALAAAMDKMTLTDFGYWIKEVCLPIEALLHINSTYHRSNKSYDVRIAINRLLLAMMTQYSSYVNAIARREQSKRGGNSLRRFKFELLNHLLVNFPTIESILYSLYMSIQEQQNPNVNVLEHLSLTLDLVLLMCKENRAFVNKTSQILDYLDVLRPLYEVNFEEVQQDKELPQSDGKQLDKVSKMKLELKSIKTILMLFPRALQPQEKLFEKVLRSFVKAYLLNDDDIRMEASEVLQRLFRNTGIFDECSYEIDLWLEALHGFDAAVVDNVVSILLTVFQLDFNAVQLPSMDVSETASNVQNLRKLFTQIEQNLTVQAYVETLSLSKLMPLIVEGVEMAAPYDAYLELVFVLLFHYHTRPAHVQQLYARHLKTHNAYMLSWLRSAKKSKAPLALPESIAQQWPLLAQVQQALLQQPHMCFEDTFHAAKDATQHFELQLEDGQSLQLDASLRNQQRNVLYVQQVLFLVTQLVARERLTAAQADLAADYLIRLLQIASQTDDAANGDGEAEAEQQTQLHRLLHYIYVVRLTQVRTTQLFSETSATQLNYVRFLRRLTAHCGKLPKFASYTGNYRLQLVKALEIALSEHTAHVTEPAQLLECVRLVQVFELNGQECVQMLELLTRNLQAADYFAEGKASHYFELLLQLLHRLVALKESVNCLECMARLRQYYVEYCGALSTSIAADQLELFESALGAFLHSYHHHIVQFDAQFFGCFFGGTRELSKGAVDLACLLLQRNAPLAEEFGRQLTDHLENKKLIYPLLDVALSSGYVLNASLLQRCYQAYKNGFLKAIEKPQKAALIYREHAGASAALVAQCMPKSECLDYCQKQLKFDTVELFQMRVLREIYKQAYAAAKDAPQQSNIFVNYVNLNVQMLALDLKKQNVDLAKLEQLAYNCYDWWQHEPQPERQQLDWTRLLNTPQWLNFCKSCLKLGMRQLDETTPEITDHGNGLLLKLLAYLCDQLYEDYDDQQQYEQSTPAMLYEMVCTHSCCLDHLLNYSATPTAVKTHLLQLLETLARKAPQALQSVHIPILLGAYQARLTHADRYALALLEHYERHDVGLAAYRPFIWGESAEAFYALRATDDERSKLQQQETSVAQVLGLVSHQQCSYTIENFPIWRELHASGQLPELQFEEPATKALRFGANSLERQVERGQQHFVQSVRRLCPKREDIYERCYDPAFMLPLLLHCFAPESMARALWPVQNGLLALSFCALSSMDKNMRLAAACCQQRYRAHFEQAKFFERPLWTQAYDNIQSGLSDLRETWLAQRRSHGGTPRVPLIPALFIARTFNLSTEPTHLLYKRLMMFLRLKESFNFLTIPEFNVLFYSEEVEHQQYREFIVDLLRSGIKCSADLFLLVSTNTFKVLLSFYGCSIATLDMNLLIISVLSTCVKIPGAVKIMLEHVGIFSWLLGVIRETEFHHFDIIEGLISILNNLWYALAASKDELPDYTNVQLRVQRLVLHLLPLLSARISVSALARLLNVMQKTAALSGQHLAVSAQQLDLLLDCAARHWPEQLASVRYVRNFGGSGASTHAEYCNWLANEQHLDGHGVLALSSLRAYVSAWWQAHNSAGAIEQVQE